MTNPANRQRTDYSWLRTDPSEIPARQPPATFSEFLKGDEVWFKLFREWLTGQSNGADNVKKIDPNAEVTDLLSSLEELRVGGNRDKRTAVNRDKSAAKSAREIGSFTFGPGYAIFAAEVVDLRDQLQRLASSMIRKAKADHKDNPGVVIPSPKDAAKQAGKRAQRATMMNALAAQKAVLDINIGLLMQVQIEKYKATAFDQFVDAYNDIASTPWDQDELSEKDGKKKDGYKARGYKEDALAVLYSSAAAVQHAAEMTNNAASKAKQVQEGQPIGNENLDALLEGILAFTNAVSEQGRALAKAARLIEQWAQAAVAHELSKNFDTVYPKLGGALFAIRSGVNIGAAVLSFFPAFAPIGIGLMAADKAAEAGTKALMVWLDKQDANVKKDILGRTYVYDPNAPAAAKVLHAVVKANNAIGETVLKYSEDLIVKPVKKVAGKVGEFAAEKAGKDAHTTTEWGERAEEAAEALVDPDHVQSGLNFLQAMEVVDELPPVSIEKGVHTLLEKSIEHLGELAGLSKDVVGKAAPIAGAVLAAKTVITDAAKFTDAQYRVLQNQAGFSDADVEHLRSFVLDNPKKDPLHRMFQSGELTVLPRNPGANGPVQLLVAGIAMSVDLTTMTVVNGDVKMISKAVKGALKSVAGNVIKAPQPYTVDWETWALTNINGQVFEGTVAGETVYLTKTYKATLSLRFDMTVQLFEVIGTAPIGERIPPWSATPDQLKLLVSGKLIRRFGLGITMGENITEIERIGRTTLFKVAGTIKNHPAPYRLHMIYDEDDGLDIMDTHPDPEVVEAGRIRTVEEVKAAIAAMGAQVPILDFNLEVVGEPMGLVNGGAVTSFQVLGRVAGHPADYAVAAQISHQYGTFQILDTQPDPTVVQTTLRQQAAVAAAAANAANAQPVNLLVGQLVNQ